MFIPNLRENKGNTCNFHLLKHVNVDESSLLPLIFNTFNHYIVIIVVFIIIIIILSGRVTQNFLQVGATHGIYSDREQQKGLFFFFLQYLNQ